MALNTISFLASFDDMEDLNKEVDLYKYVLLINSQKLHRNCRATVSLFCYDMFNGGHRNEYTCTNE